jgi:hypothetical protein
MRAAKATVKRQNDPLNGLLKMQPTRLCGVFAAVYTETDFSIAIRRHCIIARRVPKKSIHPDNARIDGHG